MTGVQTCALPIFWWVKSRDRNKEGLLAEPRSFIGYLNNLKSIQLEVGQSGGCNQVESTQELSCACRTTVEYIASTSTSSSRPALLLTLRRPDSRMLCQIVMCNMQLEGTLRMTNWSNCCAMPKQQVAVKSSQNTIFSLNVGI